MATTQKLVGANGGQLKLDGILFLKLTLGDATSSQLVHMTHRVTCLCLSKRTCKQLCAVDPNFIAQATVIGNNQRTATNRDDNNGRDCPSELETHPRREKHNSVH